MAKPTKEEVQEEIKSLKALKPKIIPMTAFGGNNVDAIAADIKVLEENLSGDDIHDLWGEDEHSCDSALYARYWLTGEEEACPSDSWAELA